MIIAGTGALVYGAAVIGLNEAWYKEFDRRSFHFFNDAGQWENMDKFGHSFTTYFESEFCYHGLKWAGLPDKASIWAGAGSGLLLQTTVEFLDAHSSRWGWSWPDMAYNILGSALFLSQQLHWSEQRFRLKISSWPRKYSKQPILSDDGTKESSLYQRTNDLFGAHLLERYLKDYNAQTIWLSVNPASFSRSSSLPKWLSLSIGYGADNIYGGTTNSWQEGAARYSLSSQQYPRKRQWYLSPDIDFTHIPTSRPWLRSIFSILNVFKVPAPTIELNSQGNFRWHWLFL
ncbi:MAG: DUF2279 domain-containing protein [Saprospiraceae bacterium]|nr:DUF2279 domain-containing protein [Saprospiraceae bacterium]